MEAPIITYPVGVVPLPAAKCERPTSHVLVIIVQFAEKHGVSDIAIHKPNNEGRAGLLHKS